MDHFTPINGIVHAEDVPLPAIAAAVGTPCYVYARATLERHAAVFRAAVAGTAARTHIAFAVKANPNLAVLNVLARQGLGADVVSAGELVRALAAGMPASGIVFSGVGKTGEEMRAALSAGIGQFNIESVEEGLELDAVARSMGLSAPAALRINPDVDAATNAKISTGRAGNKFGVALDMAGAAYARLAACPGLALNGLAVHIGSQIAALDRLETAYARIGALLTTLRAAGHRVDSVDLGGGLGVPYRPDDNLPTPAAYGAMVARATAGWDVALAFEPGRVIAGNAGILLTRVIRVKPGHPDPFVIVDAAMNDLARPALYDAYHHFEAVQPTGASMRATIVGPVCESGDTFATGRTCDRVAAGDLALFRTAGAYGATMASTYNSRALVPEVMVDGARHAVVAERIAAATIMAAEHVPDWLG